MHLISAVNLLALDVKILDQPDINEGYKRILITTNSGSFNCIVDDEYNDITGENPYAALQAILLTCLELEDGGQLTRELIEKDGKAQVSLNDFWQVYLDKVPSPRRIVSSMEWQLNSGAAYILRSLKV